MVGSSKSKSKPVKFTDVQRSVTHNSGKQGRRQKALLKRKYYLDVKNDNSRRKLEESLTSLGATIEVFFDPCVNAVVTDRQQYLTSLGNNSGPSPSPIPSLSSVYSPSGGEQAPRRNKTRLDSILELARLQPQQHIHDPLDDAKKCGVPIFSVAKFSQFLERIESLHKKEHLVKGKKLEGHFIKIESSDRKHRPIYGEFKKWTFINLNSEPGTCPFDPPYTESSSSAENDSSQVVAKSSEHKLSAKITNGANIPQQPNDEKAKSGSRMTRTGGPKLPGFCEMCNVQYSSQRSHVLCESHINAKSEVNYSALDALIARGPNMDAFVKLNKVDALNYRRSLRSDLMSPHTVNGGLRKRSKAAGARTRSMSGGQLYLPSGLLGTTAEDVGNPARSAPASVSPGRKRAHTERASSADGTLTSPQMNGGGRRHLGAKRRSQLALLSDEAQNFMFREPLGLSSSDEEEEEEDSPNSRVSVKIELDSNSLDSQGVRRKKRRSQAEAFIEDNREYYKFETPSSRLRFHETFNHMNCTDRESAPAECVLNNKDGCRRECVVKKEGCSKECFVKKEGCAIRRSRDAAVDGDEANAEVKSEPTNVPEYNFSFERVPRSEPWYQTFRRQDLGEEFYYSLPSSADEPFPLPYQLPPPRLKYPPVGGPGRRGRRRGRFGQLLERKPRKSPRCHASTLAILSGFIQRRRKDSAKGKETTDAKEVAEVKVEPPPPPPPSIVQPTTRPRGRPRRILQVQPSSSPEIKEPQGLNGDLSKLADMLDEMLDVSGDDLDIVDVPRDLDQLVPLDMPPPGVPVPVSSLMLEHCECCVQPPPPDHAKRMAQKHAEWRTRKRKKRKFNLTGWPDAKKKSKPGTEERLRRLPVKKERVSRVCELNNAYDEETNASSSYTDCAAEDSGDDSDELTLAHLTRDRDEEEDSCKGLFSLPDRCTRRLRSAGTPLARRESPRKVNKTIKSLRDSVS